MIPCHIISFYSAELFLPDEVGLKRIRLKAKTDEGALREAEQEALRAGGELFSLIKTERRILFEISPDSRRSDWDWGE